MQSMTRRHVRWSGRPLTPASVPEALLSLSACCGAAAPPLLPFLAAPAGADGLSASWAARGLLASPAVMGSSVPLLTLQEEMYPSRCNSSVSAQLRSRISMREVHQGCNAIRGAEGLRRPSSCCSLVPHLITTPSGYTSAEWKAAPSCIAPPLSRNLARIWLNSFLQDIDQL